MTSTATESATIVLTGDQIPAYRLLMIRSALRLEINTGLKMWRGVSIVKVLKADGITTSSRKDKAYADLNAHIVALGIGEHVDLN
jgi:hypothetical protein